MLNQKNQLRMGSTQKHSELGATQNTVQVREQLQFSGPAELVVNRSDLRHLSVSRLNYQLKIIDLSCNKIKSVPPEILLLVNLVSLNLKGNQLETLPEDRGGNGDKSK
jgi:Leucine-rich repeat (LRR) protein